MLAICALAVALVGGTFSNRLKTWKPVPTGALAFMQQHKLHGNMLCQFEWGSWVLWHMGDAFKVYIDPRGELVYTDKQERDYAIFFYGQSGAAARRLSARLRADGQCRPRAPTLSGKTRAGICCTAIRPRRFSAAPQSPERRP